jgi:formamidopyrimidine-DNA glycosylase
VPEIPELEAMKNVLNREVAGLAITSVEVRIPVPIRRPSKDEFVEILTGNCFGETERRGKYLLNRLGSGHLLAVHLMLTGRLKLTQPSEKIGKRIGWLLTFENESQLRYSDYRLDGRVYLVGEGEDALVPRLVEMGPDALDPELTYDAFRARLRKYPGQIKRTLVNDAFICGIGNAYSDEILFAAGVYPFARARDLTEEQISGLYAAIREVYDWSIPIVAEKMGATIDDKFRDHLKVHRKGGQPCPTCGSNITEVSPNNRITSYCRTCQDWGKTGVVEASIP